MPTLLLTMLAMLAFAGNSLLCRMALQHTAIDAASFTAIRLLSGAIVLWLVVQMRVRRQQSQPASGEAVPQAIAATAGSWGSALALFAYAITFSYAYFSLTAATGALLLFGMVQVTMIGVGLWQGERLGLQQSIGMVFAVGGLVGLLLPGLSAPPLLGAMLMLGAGVAWGIYSLRGQGVGDPTEVTAGNFLRAVPMALLASLLALPWFSPDPAGTVYAIASGALASGLGYAVWYTALRGLAATSAATVQLSVPVIAAVGGTVFLDEAFTLRLALASVAVLGGVALVILKPSAPAPRG